MDLTRKSSASDNEPSEAQEQKALIKWSERYPECRWLYACPNGGRRSPIEAKNLKAEGVKAGVSDLFLPLSRQGYSGLYIEMKRRTLGKASDLQLEFHDHVRKEGFKAEVCHGFIEAKKLLEWYLT